MFGECGKLFHGGVALEALTHSPICLFSVHGSITIVHATLCHEKVHVGCINCINNARKIANEKKLLLQ